MTKYVMYVGLNDKDSKVQEVNTLDAYKIVSNIFAETTGGVTITEGHGVYTHDDGSIVFETTLICTVFGAENKDVEKAATMIKTALNQESVAIDRIESNSRFF